MLQRIAAALSHELRNPLGALRNYLFVLEEELSESEFASLVELVKRSEGCVERCASIIDKLVEATHDPVLDLELVEFDAWLAAVLADYRASVEVEVEVDLRAADVLVAIDGPCFRRAVLHLLDNACTVAGPGGRVALASFADGGQLCLECIDSGPGLPAPPFDPFEPFAAAKAGGLGVGLSVVERFVGAHGGRIELREREDEPGTRAIVRLPLVAGAGGERS